MTGNSWQSRTAVALLIGAAGEGACVLLSEYVAGPFLLLTFVVAIALGWYFGPVFGAVGAGVPPLGLVFVADSGDDTTTARVLAVLTVVMFLGGPAWITGRVRERYGRPPWGHSTGVSE